MDQSESLKPKIEIVRVPSIERASFRPLDGVQLRAAYSHVRIGTFCPEPETPRSNNDVKPPHEQSRKYKKNLGPVSRLLRRRHHATSLATKSCDNIYSVNKSNSFIEWKHGHACHDQGLQVRQSNSLDWRVGRSVDRNSGNFECRKASRSAEHLSRSGNLHTPSTKSKIVSLLRRLSPRMPRPTSKGSLPASPSVCPWVQVEYSSTQDSVDGIKREESQLYSLESDYSFQRELQLNEIRKKAIKASNSKQDVRSEGDRKSPESCPQPKVQIEDKSETIPNHEAVHEDRGSSEEHRAGGGGEVAADAAARTSRRSRPHSLAVQPLNYQRLDPEQPKAPRPNMTSQDSIGSCSLDVERSASDRSEVNQGSASERTLHSLNLSCNGETEGPSPRIEVSSEDPVSNGYQETTEDSVTSKKPSYLGLACSISGYSGITRYDSKLREGFRSRDSSPGARLINRDTSPAGFRTSETLTPSTQPVKSQSISPLAMERHQNGFANGVRDKTKMSNHHDTNRGIDTCQGYSEVDRALPQQPLSPINAKTPNKKGSPIGTRIAACNQHNKSYSSSVSTSTPKSGHLNLSQSSYEGSILNGSTDYENCTHNSSTSSEKSFIQQRVERLYGPGALAQGFFFKRSHKLDSSDLSNKSSNNNNTSIDETNVEESLKNLPVLRHLRPEFRAQLPVVSPRRPTDGTEQIIKPLKRISISPGRNDAKENKATPVKQEKAATIDPSMTGSTTSLTDQQPAAPKVVLPVLDNSTTFTKKAIEKPKVVEEKDGHYFMNLLSKERERLIALADQAETELSSSEGTALPEEAAGKIRSAAGKARLLASQKMKQFEGLCQKNITQVPGEEFPTTREDLAGFWDMVMLQVVQVNDLFEQIERSRNSEWQEVLPEPKSTPTSHNGSAVKRRSIQVSKPKSTPNSEAARKAREAREQTRRQLIEERRRAMRSNSKKSDNSVEIFIPET